MKPPLRFGLVGTGAFAERSLVPAIAAAEGAELASVLSRDLARGRAFADRNAIPRAFGDLAAFLADDGIDAVIVASPDMFHEEHVLAAAAAGKHVLCEKPLSTSAVSARRMREACARAGVALGIGYHCRHHPAHRRLFEWIRRGELGRILHCRARFFFKRPDAENWRCRPPSRWWALSAIGTHLVDLVRAIAGEVKDVDARFASPVFGAPNEEIALLALRFESGAFGDVEAASVLATRPSRLEVHGDAGYVLSDDTIGPGGGTLYRDGAPVPFPAGDPYQGEIEDFALAVAEGRPPAASAGDGVRNVEVLEAAERSARGGRREAPERG